MSPNASYRSSPPPSFSAPSPFPISLSPTSATTSISNRLLHHSHPTSSIKARHSTCTLHFRCIHNTKTWDLLRKIIITRHSHRLRPKGSRWALEMRGDIVPQKCWDIDDGALILGFEGCVYGSRKGSRERAVEERGPMTSTPGA